MECRAVCHHAGCEWCGSLSELEKHEKNCTYRPSQCLYCQTLFPYNTLDEHSMNCLSAKFESLLKLEQLVSVSLQPKDDPVQCPNADKHCPWEGHERDLKVHLHICYAEEYKPTRAKRLRIG
ncbi:hypothetical protein BsWGS_21811 [Bradybaena similaris]